MKLSELKTDENIKILLFGESGSGKTCFASNFPGPTHYYDFDLKVGSVNSFNKNIDHITFDQYPLDKSDPGGAGKRFNHDMGELKKLAVKGEFPYKTIVIDSLTTLSDRLMEHIMRENPGVKRTPTKLAQAPALQDYGMFRIFMKQFIAEILALPCNIIMVAHVEIIKDETTGQLLRVPMLTGKLAKELVIYFEEVYYAYVEGEGSSRKYMLQTQADKKFNCRSQRGLPPTIGLDYNELIAGMS